MKGIKKVVGSLVLSSSILGFNVLETKAESASVESVEDEEFLSVQQEIAELEKIIYEIYSTRIKEIGDAKKKILENNAENSFKSLSQADQRSIQLTEIQIKDLMQAEIDEAMSTYGWEKTEENLADTPTPFSVSGNISLTNSMYKNSSGYQVYTTNWDWSDGKWDDYADIEDIMAIRSTSDITSRLSANIYAFDNYGTDYSANVSRRDWEADGALFNIHDANLSYGWGGTMPIYKTDNGYAIFTFKAPAGSEIYTHFAHNYKETALGLNASFNVLDLKNSELIVSYSRENKNWATVTNPRTTK
ncbi:hypothetical protein [Lysinibacillus sp. LZ02]|uniref:hypothetical protein n=1 Tax=Lysinibacillus sp. LZ02 TaxID=3420668 RepID=UPI003D35BA53